MEKRMKFDMAYNFDLELLEELKKNRKCAFCICKN